MATVKYSGPIASFHCPTEATIRSLKVHFSPKQLGSGTPSPENVREIVGWDGVTIHNDTDGNIIPEEYQKVKYIYIDSNQYIDTQYAPINSPEIRVTMEFISSGDLDYFGFANNTAPSFIVDYNLGSKIWYNRWGATSAKNLQPYPDKNIRYNLVFGKNTSINGVVVKTYPDYDWSTNQQTLRIGGGRNLGAQLNIYALQFYDGVLKFNLIPCRRKSDNKPGMYDTVSGEFFTNQGTGEFICGPDVGETIDYEFGVLGKNKLDIPDTSFTRLKEYSLFKSLKPGVYTVSALITSTDTDKTTSSIMFENGKVGDANLYVQLDRDTRSSKTFTLQQECSRIYLYAAAEWASSENDTCSWTDVQLELGSTATSYEPYDPKHTVYGGWVDLISGEVCEEYYKWIITPDNFTLNNVYTGGICFEKVLKTIPSPNGVMIEQKFTHGTVINPYGGNTGCNAWAYSAGGSKVRIGFSDSYNLSSVEDFYNWLNLQTDEVAITYKTNTPNTYHLAPTSMQTFLSHNNIWSNADYVEVEYDLHETQNILARKQFIIANQPHVEKLAAAPLQSFETDMAAPIKECKIHFEPIQDLHGYSKPWVGGAGKNLFNAATSTPKRFIDTTGNINISNDWSASDFIKAKAETTYALTAPTSASSNTARIAFYDSNQDLISTLGAYDIEANNNIFTTPVNTAYIRISVRTETPTDVQLEVGSAATSYESYENICPIEGWQNIEVYKSGKNLCPAATSTEMYENWDYYDSGRNYILNGLPPGQEMTLQCNLLEDRGENISNLRLYLRGSNYGFINTATPAGRKYLTRNVSSNGKIRISHNNLGLAPTSYNVQFNNVQLEIGSIATDYEPYQGQTIPITFPSEAGTVYGGYVDLVTGEIVAEQISATFTINDATSFNDAYSNTTMYRFQVYKPLWGQNNQKITYCDKAKYEYSNSDKVHYYMTTNNINGNIYIWFPKNFDQTETVTFVVSLYIPEVIGTLTPIQLKSLRGTNNIWSNANGNIELSYWKH